jgi:hypothetical protein
MIPITLTAFRGDRFGFLPDLFAVNPHHFYDDLSTVKASITLHVPHRSVVIAFIRLVIQKVRMICVPIRRARAEFPNHTLALSSCDTGCVDQLALDCLSFIAGTLVGRLISQNLDFVACQDPYNGDSTTLSSAIDVYSGDVPALGPSIFLRVASALPAAKRLIVDYAHEVVDFAKGAGVGRIQLVPREPNSARETELRRPVPRLS